MESVSPKGLMNYCGESVTIHPSWHLFFYNFLKCTSWVSFPTSSSYGRHAGECVIRPMREETDQTMLLALHEQSGNPTLSGQANSVISAGSHI